MSVFSFPNLWIPRRRLWTPDNAVYTAGKAQRKSDGKLPRKTTTGTAGKTPRKTSTPSGCCCTAGPSTCACDNSSHVYRSKLLISVSSVVVPLLTCITDQNGNTFKYSSCNPNGTYCLSYISTLFLPGPSHPVCLYTFAATAATSFLQPCGSGSPQDTLTWNAYVDTVDFRVCVVIQPGLTGVSADIFNSEISLILPFNSAYGLGCGGTSSALANTRQYTIGGSTFNYGGTVTVTDGGC